MCIFCSIVEGSIPSKKVYEDDICMAILDISQATKGHTLVIPKKHFDDVLACDDETLAHMIVVTKKLANQIVTNLKADGVNIVNNCKEAAGQAVMHLHFHIIPRYVGDDYYIRGQEHSYDLDEVLSQIKGE